MVAHRYKALGQALMNDSYTGAGGYASQDVPLASSLLLSRLILSLRFSVL